MILAKAIDVADVAGCQGLLPLSNLQFVLLTLLALAENSVLQRIISHSTSVAVQLQSITAHLLCSTHSLSISLNHLDQALVTSQNPGEGRLQNSPVLGSHLASKNHKQALQAADGHAGSISVSRTCWKHVKHLINNILKVVCFQYHFKKVGIILIPMKKGWYHFDTNEKRLVSFDTNEKKAGIILIPMVGIILIPIKRLVSF